MCLVLIITQIETVNYTVKILQTDKRGEYISDPTIFHKWNVCVILRYMEWELSIKKNSIDCIRTENFEKEV